MMPFTEQGLPMRFGFIGCRWIVEWAQSVADGAPAAPPPCAGKPPYSAGSVALPDSRKAAAHAR
jgi:hypothetical protein